MTDLTSTVVAVEEAGESPARRERRGWRALFGSPTGVAAFVASILLLALAVFAPIIWGEAAQTKDLDALSEGPSAAHPFGTDALGRDILLRVLVATRLSLELALGATLVGVVVGVLLGALPSVVGRRGGRFLVAAVSIAVAFPGLLLALFFAAIFGVGAIGAMLALGLAFAPGLARLTQTLAAAVAGRDFISAARVVGVGRVRVLFRHVLPNIAEPLIVNTTLTAAGSLLAFAGLSFLGVGVQPPAYDWGRMLAEGLNDIYVNPMAALGPGLAVVLAALSLNLTGEAAAAVLGRRSARGKVAARPPVVAPAPTPAADAVLDVADLWVRFPSRAGEIAPVRGVSLRVAPGEAVGIVGESGSGKSLTALAVARLIERPGAVFAARLDFNGESLLGGSAAKQRAALGTSMAMVFQDPMSSLNPAMKVGRQLAEVAQEHQHSTRRAAMTRAVDRLRAVRIPSPELRSRQYPHEFSGGMRQRAMIGMGLMGTPALLIADEPTTALDVTVQRDVLELIGRVRADDAAALLLISHDIAVVSAVCDRVLVMYAGRVVEDIPVQVLLSTAAHPYTRALLAAVPDMDTPREAELATIPGRPPEPGAFPAGCAFADRCPLASARCRIEDPELADPGVGHRVACWHPQIGAVRPEPVLIGGPS